jgi:hypothetical protein
MVEMDGARAGKPHAAAPVESSWSIVNFVLLVSGLLLFLALIVFVLSRSKGQRDLSAFFGAAGFRPTVLAGLSLLVAVVVVMNWIVILVNHHQDDLFRRAQEGRGLGHGPCGFAGVSPSHQNFSIAGPRSLGGRDDECRATRPKQCRLHDYWICFRCRFAMGLCHDHKIIRAGPRGDDLRYLATKNVVPAQLLEWPDGTKPLGQSSFTRVAKTDRLVLHFRRYRQWKSDIGVGDNHFRHDIDIQPRYPRASSVSAWKPS